MMTRTPALPVPARFPAAIAALAAAGLLVTACGDEFLATSPVAQPLANRAAEQAPGSVEITPAEAELRVGETLQLAAVVKNPAGRPVPNQPVDFSSSDEDVATVTGGGLGSTQQTMSSRRLLWAPPPPRAERAARRGPGKASQNNAFWK